MDEQAKLGVTFKMFVALPIITFTVIEGKCPIMGDYGMTVTFLVWGSVTQFITVTLLCTVGTFVYYKYNELERVQYTQLQIMWVKAKYKDWRYKL